MSFQMRWPTRYGKITQKFGENPALYGKFGLPGHEGLDIASPQYSPIYAVNDGLVGDIRLDVLADPLLKPYGNQIRLQHVDGYETIYAHLSQVVVLRGQAVKAKQLIGLSGTTGYATAAHLHLGLKKPGATLGGETSFPYDLVDPEPYLVAFGSDADLAFDTPDPSLTLAVNSPTASALEIRALPFAGAELITEVGHDTTLEALEEAAVARAKAGRDGQWLWVRTQAGLVGWAVAQSLSLVDGDLGPSNDAGPRLPIDPDVVVFVVVDTAGENLLMRFGPGTEYDEVARFSDGTVMRALDAPEVVENRVGQPEAWLHVQAPAGQVGYCAAWYVKLKPFSRKPVIPQPPKGTSTSKVVVDCPELGLRLRAGPGTNHEVVWSIPHRTVLTSLEDPETTGGKVGQHEAWIHVRTPSRYEGYAAAWYLRYPSREDDRVRTNVADVPAGVSPHIFGIHALALSDDQLMRDRIRGLYIESGKAGWTLFTEICGHYADAINFIPEIRRRVWNWGEAGYGVIVRLNHGYEPGGTLPVSRFYDDYAAAAARWVELYLTDVSRSPADYTWTIQIGNEQNNPREHPGGLEHPLEHITPEMYADAFNRTYARIKAVLPNATVCPGALDPYNYAPMPKLGNVRWRPLDYFETMMENIDVLDGVILHTYTHGPNLDAITDLKRFGDGTGPLWDHYYDFQSYRVFMERIPSRWRDVPVYITEMDHIFRPSGEYDLGWVDQNVGWIRAAYAEIDRWNQQPYAQQIRCGLVYRWTGDAWAIDKRDGVLTDFRQALANDYRWRAATAPGVIAYEAPLSHADDSEQGELEERVLTRPDDLKRMRGVGEKAEAALHAAGLRIYDQLACLTPDRLMDIIGETDLRAPRAGTWPEQARLLVAGKWNELKRYWEL